MNRAIEEYYNPQMIMDIPKLLVRVGPMRSGSPLEMRTFLGVFIKEDGDVVRTLVRGESADLTKCVFMRGSQITREKIAGPVGRLP